MSAPHCEREGKGVDPPVTLEMIRRGVDAFFAWNPKSEEPEALVMAVYCAMAKAAS